MGGKKTPDSGAILARIIDELRDLPSEEQQNLLETLATFFKLRAPVQGPRQLKSTSALGPASLSPGGGFSEQRDMSPKEFIIQKEPHTDVERVACLAFYLTHYRNSPHFKTIEISKLNTEAAQSKMSNVHMAVENATRTGYLVPAGKGTKQISAAGEAFVQTLPDRAAARAAMGKLMPRRRPRKAAKAR